MHDATLVFSYPDPATARALAGALSPELAVSEVPKTRADVLADGRELRVHIHAGDLGALRAAINSYLRWIDAGERAAGVGAAPR